MKTLSAAHRAGHVTAATETRVAKLSCLLREVFDATPLGIVIGALRSAAVERRSPGCPRSAGQRRLKRHLRRAGHPDGRRFYSAGV